jgi:hypothetical protein
MKKFNEWLGEKNESWDFDPETRKYIDWSKRFTAEFPVGNYNPNSRRDRDSLFSGRITWVLDELGETDKLWQYISGVNAAESNYYKLLTRLVERNHPEMLAQWKDDGYGGRDR